MKPIALSDETLVAIHAKVYRKYGYPTLEDGLRAFKRVRRFADNPDNLKKAPPSHLREKLGIWANINKEIKIALNRTKTEVLTHGKKEDDSQPKQGAETREVIQVLK